jgi:hypothetical protein
MKTIALVLIFFNLPKLNAQWLELGGVNSLVGHNYVNIICRDKSGNIYASAGYTSQPNGGPFISKWDGQSWSKLEGLNPGFVKTIAVEYSGIVYAALSSSVDVVTKWDGNSWSDIGSPLTGPGPSIFKHVTDYSGNLYASGVDNFSKPYVAKWNSSGGWMILGNFAGLTSYGGISAICSDKAGNIYATGGFTNSAGNYYVARWDGNGWAEVGGLNGLAPNGFIYTIHCDANDNLLAGGSFTNSNGNFYVAKWNGVNWSQEAELATVFQNADTGIINLCNDDAGNLYIGGGLFSKISLQPVVCRWDGISLVLLYGGPASHTSFLSLCTDTAGNLYAAGTDKHGYQNKFVAMYANAKYVGINEQQVDSRNISIFPNPTANKITVQLKGDSKISTGLISIRINNILGKTVYNEQFLQRESTLDLSNLSPGLYFVSVNVNGHWHTSKIVKE